MTDNEMLDAMRDLLRPINLKLEKMENRMDNMECEIKKEISDLKKDVSNLKLEVNTGFRKNNDEIETLVTVLRGKGILPVA